MKKTTWNVCYSHVDKEEASIGETDRRGFIVEDVGLREAISHMTDDMDKVACYGFSSEPPCGGNLWIIVNGRNWRTGDGIENTLHCSEPITVASWRRIMRLVKGG